MEIISHDIHITSHVRVFGAQKSITTDNIALSIFGVWQFFIPFHNGVVFFLDFFYPSIYSIQCCFFVPFVRFVRTFTKLVKTSHQKQKPNKCIEINLLLNQLENVCVRTSNKRIKFIES